MERVMRYYSKMFRVFVTKQVSGFAGTNHELDRWNDDVQEVCPNCGMSGESTKHMTRCRNEGRVQLFRLSVEDVLVRLHDAGVDLELVDLFKDYLLAQGSRSMEDCLRHSNSEYTLLAQVQNCLGWDCLVDGCISTLLLETGKPFLTQNRRRSLDK